MMVGLTDREKGNTWGFPCLKLDLVSPEEPFLSDPFTLDEDALVSLYGFFAVGL